MLVSNWVTAVDATAEVNGIIVCSPNALSLHCCKIKLRYFNHCALCTKMTKGYRSCTFLLLPSPHQREAREGEKGEDPAAGSDQDRGIRRRGGHGERKEDLPAANVWGGEFVPVKQPDADLSHARGSHGWSSLWDSIFYPWSTAWPGFCPFYVSAVIPIMEKISLNHLY